jgi:glutathione synthase/RimK-type ligase-like ATP-grasp enzyme
MTRHDVAIVTHAGIPGGTMDDRALAAAVAELGARTRLAVWDDPAVDWHETRLAVIRSTWDYHLAPAAWFAWLDAVAEQTRLVNDPDLVRWNSDKRYLLDLESRGVAIVPTALVSRGARCDLAALAAERGWKSIVVKPAIGASAKGAGRFGSAAPDRAAAQVHLELLLQAGDALIQPFQAAVETERERSLVFLGGVYSHAFSKPAFLTGTGDGAGEALHQATTAERALADALLAAVAAPVTYARVDLVPTPDGPHLMELELIEPDLGLRLHAPAAGQLAAAIVTLL